MLYSYATSCTIGGWSASCLVRVFELGVRLLDFRQLPWEGFYEKIAIFFWWTRWNNAPSVDVRCKFGVGPGCNRNDYRYGNGSERCRRRGSDDSGQVSGKQHQIS